MAVFDAHGREALYYRMDSLAFQSSDIVLCDAGESIEKRGVTSFTVARTMKGELQPAEKINVEISMNYEGDYPSRRNNAVAAGRRALLFLERKETAVSPLPGPYSPVPGGVKVIVEGEVYCYIQHDNPGPLHLALMTPENLQVADSEDYNEALLLKELEIALEKAKHLERPVSSDQRHVRFRPRKSALPFEIRYNPLVLLGASFVVPFILVGLWRSISWWWKRSRKSR